MYDEKIFLELLPYIKKRSETYKLPGYTKDDIYSECYTTIIEYLHNNSVEEYSIIYLKQCVARVLRHRMEKLERDINKTEDNLYLNDALYKITYKCKISTNYLFALANRLVSERSFDIFKKYYTSNKTLDEIGKEYNLSRERVRQIINKVTKQILIYCRLHQISREDFE